MPGRLKVKVIAGRHLPIMDRASDLTDAFVEVKFGSVTHKTDVFSKSLNPMWNSDWFKFEVDDELLQDEPLQIRVLDHDTYSAHDAIGKVYIDIDPLLDPDFSGSLYGWFPIYDTMHGVRGEILLRVKLELFADSNQFKQSSCGIKFICATRVPNCYDVTAVHGFIHELLVNEDPEYQWIDKLRTPRASNETRQRLFSKMSGELQRRLGSMVESYGGNAVLGFQQSFDVEEDYGVVVRGIGTAVSVEPTKNQKTSSYQKMLTTIGRQSPLNTSIDNNATESSAFTAEKVDIQAHLPLHGITKEFPFYTLQAYAAGFVLRLSVMVSAHSVKLLEKMHAQEESETREAWWRELRQEVKSQCFALSCNAVIGYSEQTSVRDEVIVLSAQGSAAVIDTSYFQQQHHSPDKTQKKPELATDSSSKLSSLSASSSGVDLFRAPLHLNAQVCPMHFQPSPANPDVLVPGVFFATIDVPSNVRCIGKATFIQARYCRSKKKSQGESSAALVSDILPFIEYELHKQLYNKLKLRCMNAVFGLKTSITLGENLVVGAATGTAVQLEALPTSEPCCISGNRSLHNPTLEQRYVNFANACKANFGTYPVTRVATDQETRRESSEIPNLGNTSLDGKQQMAVGVEDADDELEISSYLEDRIPPTNCHVSTLERCPGVSGADHLLQTFSSLRRVRYRDDADDAALNVGLRRACEEALAGVWFRLRVKSPHCNICSLRFRFVLPDDDELQIWITGSAVVSSPMDDVCKVRPGFLTIDSSPSSSTQSNPNSIRTVDLQEPVLEKESSSDSGSDEAIQVASNSVEAKAPESPLLRLARATSRRFKRSSSSSYRFRRDSSSGGRTRHYSGSGYGGVVHDFGSDLCSKRVAIVPMANVPGHVTSGHIGILNMFIIRETTAVRGSDEEIAIGEPANGTGCSWFVTRSLAETNALIRAHVMAIGGNALTSYRTSYCVLKESLTKNQAQILFHVTGDVVTVSAA